MARERLFYIGNSWRSFLFFSRGICHGFCYCLFESTWAELRGGVFLLFISEMVQALAHVVLEEKKKNPPLSRAEDVFRFQWVFTQYGKVTPLYPEESRFSAFRPRHSIPIRCTSLKLWKWES